MVVVHVSVNCICLTSQVPITVVHCRCASNDELSFYSCPGNAIKLVEAIQLVVADIDYVAQTEVVTLKSHLNMLHVKLCQIITGASSSVVTQQGNG